MMNIFYHLEKMEEVLRTAPRNQSPSGGLIIEVPEDTAQLWVTVLREVLTLSKQAIEVNTDLQAALARAADSAARGAIEAAANEARHAEQLQNYDHGADNTGGAIQAMLLILDIDLAPIVAAAIAASRDDSRV